MKQFEGAMDTQDILVSEHMRSVPDTFASQRARLASIESVTHDGP